MFGRGGEEAEYLRERGIPFVVIPGVTSAIAAPAYAGIPVTHRDLASSFAVITGHERDDARESGTRAPGEAEGRRRWDKIAHAADTLLFLMGVENLEEIASQLMDHGRAASTPVALVRWGTWAGRQETLTGTLGDIVRRSGRRVSRRPPSPWSATSSRCARRCAGSTSARWPASASSSPAPASRRPSSPTCCGRAARSRSSFP